MSATPSEVILYAGIEAFVEKNRGAEFQETPHIFDIDKRVKEALMGTLFSYMTLKEVRSPGHEDNHIYTSENLDARAILCNGNVPVYIVGVKEDIEALDNSAEATQQSNVARISGGLAIRTNYDGVKQLDVTVNKEQGVTDLWEIGEESNMEAVIGRIQPLHVQKEEPPIAGVVFLGLRMHSVSGELAAVNIHIPLMQPSSTPRTPLDGGDREM